MTTPDQAKAAFDMPPVAAGFPVRGRWLIDHLSADLKITETQAAGIVGNIGYESGGLVQLQEVDPIAGRGGRAWPQWTGERRVAFETWCSTRGQDPDADEAIYTYMLYELTGKDQRNDYRYTVEALKRTTTVEAAVFSAGQTYERPYGITPDYLPGFDDRLKYAMQALGGDRSATIQPTAPPVDPPREFPYKIHQGQTDESVRDVQRELGIIQDAVFGRETAAAVRAFQTAHGLAVTGGVDWRTWNALMGIRA